MLFQAGIVPVGLLRLGRLLAHGEVRDFHRGLLGGELRLPRRQGTKNGSQTPYAARMSDDGDHENEKTSSLLWPAYVLDHEDGTRMVVLNVADLGEWRIRDVRVDEAEDETRLLITLRPGREPIDPGGAGGATVPR